MTTKIIKRVYSFLICYLCGISCGMAQLREITIQGSYDHFAGDSLVLRYWTALPNSRIMDKAYCKQVAPVNDRNEFVFRLLSSEPVYLELQHNLKNHHQHTVISNYIAGPGDSIVMDIRNDTAGIRYAGQFAFFKQEILFKGKGSAKFRCKSLLDSLKIKMPPGQPDMPDTFRNSKLMKKINWSYQRARLKQQEMLAALQAYRDSISPQVYSMLYLDTWAQRLDLFYRHLNLMANELAAANADERKIFERFYLTALEKPVEASPGEKSASVEYPSYLLNKYNFESKFFKKYTVLEYINREHTGLLKERLLTEHFVLHYDQIQEKDALDKYTGTISSPAYHELLTNLEQHQAKGKRIADHDFTDTAGKTVRISNFKGKTIFLDFWFTGCSGCLLYYRNIVSKVEERLRNDTNIVFMTISIDVDKNKWLKSVRSGKYTKETVVNLFTSGKGNRHPVIDDLGIRSFPRPIVIDRKGNIYNNNQADLRTSPERLEAVILSASE